MSIRGVGPDSDAHRRPLVVAVQRTDWKGEGGSQGPRGREELVGTHGTWHR